MEIGLTPHDAPDGGLHYVVSGKGADFPMSEGLAGGYPGAPNSYIWVKNNEAGPTRAMPMPDSASRSTTCPASSNASPGGCSR